MSIPYIRVTFSALTKVIRSEVVQESREEELNLACLICLCLEEFSVNAIISRKDDLTSTIKPCVLGETVDHWALLCACTGWVRSVPLSCGWVLQLPERVGIAYLVCFVCLFPISYIPCLHFPSLFSKKGKRRKKNFPFIIIRHKLCYPPIYITH